ncbi:MAG: hypothetical protein K6F37_09660 [Lachnospiraceae bacterium]|nr:hypothetical protein [Lachnospiraceae bacterium]
MENYLGKLEEQLRELDALQKLSDKKLRRFKGLPDNHIRVSTSNGCYQYFIVDKSRKECVYVPSAEIKNVQKFVQRDYEVKVNKTIKGLRTKLAKFIKNYDIDAINKVYDNSSPGKQKLITPLVKTKEDLIKEWREEHPSFQNTFPLECEYLTNRGESVRSKSEKIIADLLGSYNVPYQYEPLLELQGYYSVYPDFAVLNVRTGKKYYWEHLGIVSDPDYAIKNFWKIQKYEKSGYLIGRDVILTFESEGIPLDVNLIKEKIEEFLL